MPRLDDDASLAARMAAAKARGEANAPLNARSARYDRDTGRLVLEIGSGAEIAILIASIGVDRFDAATADELSDIEVLPHGVSLRWPRLDVGLSASQLVRDATGLTEVFRRAGQVKSAAKSAAVRENGKKGGRPRKTSEPT